MKLTKYLIATALATWIVLLALSCGDDDGASPTPSITTTPTAGVPTAEFPPGVEDFARTLDRAFAGGEIDVVKFTRFSDWNCPSNYFPAAGPNCTQVSDGEGVKAVAIGAYNSEGDIYSGPAYGRFLTDYIYDALMNESDEYGYGAARVYAIADMPDEFEGGQGVLGAYEIITTRIAESAGDEQARREVLVFTVAGTQQGWLVTHLLRAPADLLDPASEESAATFTAWARWTEPAPTGGLVSRWPERFANREVAYQTPDGEIFVAPADGGSEPRRIAEAICTPSGPAKNPPSWSGDADRVAILCGFDDPSVGQPFLEVYDPASPGDPAVIENVSTYAWSPTQHRIAYQTADIMQGGGAAIVRVRNLNTGEDALISDNAILRAWPRQDELLLGLNPERQSGDIFIFATYDAAFYNLTTGATEPVEHFDNNRQFWFSAPANQAVILDGPSARKEGGATLAVYDLNTGEETVLDGRFIGYPSEGIPHWMVETSTIDARFVWADWDAGPGLAISEAALDGSLATFLDRVPELVDGISADGLVLYHTYDKIMILLDTKTGAETAWSDAVIGAIAPV